MDDPINIIGLVLTVASLAYGIYQNRTRAKLEKMVRNNAWSTYRTCYQTFLSIWQHYQACEEKGDISADLAKAEASVRELHRKCIEQVIAQYESLTEADLNHWKSNGKLVDKFSYNEFRSELNK